MSSKTGASITSLVCDKSHSDVFTEVGGQVDPLFNSSLWQTAWWKRWGGEFKSVTLQLEESKKIIFRAALYVDEFKFKNLIPIKRLQFVGTNYQNLSTPRAEYLGFSEVKEHSLDVQLALNKLETIDWDEFVARDIVKESKTDIALNKWANQNNWKSRVVHYDIAYFVDTTGCFDEYKANLSASTRLKLINRRKLLSTLGEVKIENYYPDKVDAFFELLGFFHQQRWGEGFSSKTNSFHSEIIEKSGSLGLGVELSVLSINGECQSLMFNYIMDGRVYNINSGFSANVHKKLAIGILHFGYLIEASFDDPDIKVFDFLAGEGKNENYKAKLATNSIDLYSLQVVRSRMLALLYSANDLLKRLIGKVI